jgi:hypothetical protein
MRRTPSVCKSILLWTALFALGPAHGEGLRAGADALGFAPWSARLEVTPGSLAPQLAVFAAQQPALTPLRLYSDFQFSSWRLGQGGGLRLTSGLWLNTRTSAGYGLSRSEAERPLAYAGIGYSLVDPGQAWDISADLGMTASGLGSLKLDRLFTGNASLIADSTLRLTPQVRLGMRLRF